MSKHERTISPSTTMLTVAFSLLLLSCSTDNTTAPASPVRPMIVCDGCSGDGSINAYDSNVSGDVTTHLSATYSSDQSFPDPETGTAGQQYFGHRRSGSPAR